MAKIMIAAKHLLARCERGQVEAKRRGGSPGFRTAMSQGMPIHSPQAVQQEIAHLATVANRAIELAGAESAAVTIEEREVSSLEWALGL
jgi:hypothetical protein